MWNSCNTVQYELWALFSYLVTINLSVSQHITYYSIYSIYQCLTVYDSVIDMVFIIILSEKSTQADNSNWNNSFNQ